LGTGYAPVRHQAIIRASENFSYADGIKKRDNGPLFLYVDTVANHFPWDKRWRPEVTADWHELGDRIAQRFFQVRSASTTSSDMACPFSVHKQPPAYRMVPRLI